MYSAYTSDEPFLLFCNFFIFFHLSHMILEVELTRNIDIKNDGLTSRVHNPQSVQRHINVCHDSFSTLRHFHVAACAGRDIRYMKMYMKMT